MFDRDADFVTPLLTQLTYEGSIDEHFTIQAGVVELPEQLVADNKQQKSSGKVMLNSKDSVFESIRHKHFAGVAAQLVRKAKEIQTEKESSKGMTPAQMKVFVADRLKVLQAQQNSISLHLSICEAITKATRRDFDTQLTTEHGLVTGATSVSDAKQYFEDCCARQLPLSQCLRLLCLISQTQNTGLTQKELETLSGQVVAACGHRHLVTLLELREAGLLCVDEEEVSALQRPQDIAIKGLRHAASTLISSRHQNTSSWRSLSKMLKLIPDPEEVIELHNPNHLSYVFNGAYTPVIPQLVSLCLTKGVAHVTDAFRLLPGNTILEGFPSDLGVSAPSASVSSSVVIVLVLGGVTFIEIAALKLLGIRTGNRIIVASTGTLTGNKLITTVANT